MSDGGIALAVIEVVLRRPDTWVFQFGKTDDGWWGIWIRPGDDAPAHLLSWRPEREDEARAAFDDYYRSSREELSALFYELINETRGLA